MRVVLDEEFLQDRAGRLREIQMALIVSPMKAEQAGEAAALISRTISALPYYNDRAKREELAKYSESRLVDLAAEDSDAVLVAVDGERIIGFCVSRYDDALIWLSWFGVDESNRRRGVGKALLAALTATLPRRNAHKIWCDSRTANQASARALEQFGFRRITEVRNHWYGQDFFLWEWDQA
jgi:RimJ/RimL family protein N-acetyltransferase